MVLSFLHKSVLEVRDTFGRNDSRGIVLVVGGDVTQTHDSWESVVALCLTDVLHNCSTTPGTAYLVSKLSRLLRNLSYTSSRVFLDSIVLVFEQRENPWEYLLVYNLICKVL